MIMDRMNSVNAAGSCTNSWERLSQKGSLDDSSIAITDRTTGNSDIGVPAISHPDSDYAAKAVKIVVGNTRRGIVPLCTELADILRHKASLERSIIKLKAQNRALRYTQEYAKSQVLSDQMEQPEMDIEDDISLQSVSPQLSSVSQRRSKRRNNSQSLQEIEKLTLENSDEDSSAVNQNHFKLLINKLSLSESENTRLKQDLLHSKEGLRSSEKEVKKLKNIIASLQSNARMKNCHPLFKQIPHA